MDGAHNRNNLTLVNTVRNYEGHRDSYMTYYRYNDEMVDHFNEKRSVGGYKGKAYADWLPIDIDSEDLQEAQDNLFRLVEQMEQMEIESDVCRFYFSGAKGFHVMIPSQLFNASPSEDIHKRFRKVALSIAKGINIDTSIYDKTRIFRLPNTVNSKTGLYKIELYGFEALQMSIDEIKSRAEKPVDRLDIEEEFDPIEELVEIYNAPLDAGKKVDNKGIDGVETYLCMKKMNEGVGAGNRDNVGVRVVAHLKRSGLSRRMIWAALDEWNQQNDPPMETYEIERLFEQGLQDYTYGCHDHILKSYCDPKCKFYQSHWNRF